MAKAYIGLMSGTSLDGVDGVIMDAVSTQLLAQTHLAYDDKLKKTLRVIIQTKQTELQNLAAADIKVANFFAKAANILLAKAVIPKHNIIAIGAHGQTIFHQGGKHSMQIGNGALISEQTGISVVCDFRMSDIAAGGQGAPLTPIYHQHLLCGKAGVVVNLGGIANLTIAENDKISGFDSGPANTLLDCWMRKCKQLDYDKDGLWARTGVVDEALLQRLLAADYFKKSAPKSTGCEYFNLNWLHTYLQGSEADADVQATLLELTAVSISRHIPQNCVIYLCGGGAHNLFLMERLQALNPKCRLTTTADLGVSVDYVEAAAFAFLAKQTIENTPSNLPAVTGAAYGRVLGAIYAAP